MKVLVWDMFDLRNTGGPSGYVYNIYKYLAQNPNSNIEFLSNILPKTQETLDTNNEINDNEENNSSKNKSILKETWRNVLSVLDRLPKLKGFITKTIDYTYRIWNIKWNLQITTAELSGYDCIHFHFLEHLRQFTNTFPDYRGIKILTTHSPCPWADEKIDADKSIRVLKPILIKRECKTYEKADYLMFPCPQAKEPYNHSKPIRDTLKKMENRTFYTPTAILADSSTKPQTIAREEYNIPKDSLVIGFFGRHNQIKGFDILKQIASSVLDECQNIHIISAGVGEIQPLSHPRWHELGYISNVKDVMKICDVYVLPNRETYFDIVMLEALRAGMIVLMSETGGNKYFQTIPDTQTKGLLFFDINHIDSAVRQIMQLYSLKDTNPLLFNQMKRNNRELFDEYFTMGRYISSYLNTIEARVLHR